MKFYGVLVRNTGGFHPSQNWHLQAIWFNSREDALKYALETFGNHTDTRQYKIVERSEVLTNGL